jgi:hypothetical protein
MSRPVDEYVEAEVHRLLTEHPELAEQGLVLHRREGTLLVQGEVESPYRRDQIRRLISQRFPDVRIECDIGVIRAQAPVDAEEL